MNIFHFQEITTENAKERILPLNVSENYMKYLLLRTNIK